MANGGAFGNPLTTGIALNFEVDMTPYRQMMQDNLQFAQTQAAERKKKEKEFQDILKNIAYDDSKIHQRMRDDARIEYAATIEDVMELKKKNDFGGIMNRIAKFDSKLNNYVDATTNFRAYEKALEDGKSWVDMDYVNAYNNPDKFDDRYLIDNFSDVAIYDKEAGVFSAQAIPKQDEVAFVNKYMQGMKDQFMRDDKGKIKRSGFLSETGDYAYLKSKSADPESFYQELGLAWLGGGRNNIEHMRRKMGLKPEDLEGTIDTPSGPMAKSAYYATEFMKGVAEPKMYSEELRRPAKDTDKTDYTRPGVVGKVQIAEATPTPISKEAFNFESYKKGAVPFIEAEIAKIIEQNPGNDAAIAAAIEKKTGPTGEVKDANDFFGPNIISVRGTEVNIDKPTEAAKQIADALSQIDENDFKSISGNFGYSEPTPTEVVKDFEKTATINVFGRDIRKTFKIPKGEVYIVGSKGSKKVKILNAVDVPNSTFRTVNRDKQNDIWHGIDFPVEEESAIKQVLNEALGKDVLDDFVKSNGLPKTFIVPEVDENIQTLQTLDKELTPEFLDAELKRIGVYGAGTTSTASTSTTGGGGSKYDKYKR
jgi:hypothetical protein